MAGDNERIQSIDRALDILLLLQQEGHELGVTQISGALGMYKSTVHRTLATLEAKGFVQQNPDTGRYWLGLRLYSLGLLLQEKLPLKKIAYPHAKALSDKYREVVHVSVLDISAMDYPKQIIIDKIESQQVLSVTPVIGSIASVHCSAMGKCLLAFSPPGYLERFVGHPLPRFTDSTITDWNRLLAELERIRQNGYALDEEELEMGLTCVASPVFGRDRHAAAALSLSGPTARIRSKHLPDIIQSVRETAQTISALMH